LKVVKRQGQKDWGDLRDWQVYEGFTWQGCSTALRRSDGRIGGETLMPNVHTSGRVWCLPYQMPYMLAGSLGQCYQILHGPQLKAEMLEMHGIRAT
jgi:hypothetical protein